MGVSFGKGIGVFDPCKKSMTGDIPEEPLPRAPAPVPVPEPVYESAVPQLTIHAFAPYGNDEHLFFDVHAARNHMGDGDRKLVRFYHNDSMPEGTQFFMDAVASHEDEQTTRPPISTRGIERGRLMRAINQQKRQTCAFSIKATMDGRTVYFAFPSEMAVGDTDVFFTGALGTTDGSYNGTNVFVVAELPPREAQTGTSFFADWARILVGDIGEEETICSRIFILENDNGRGIIHTVSDVYLEAIPIDDAG